MQKISGIVGHVAVTGGIKLKGNESWFNPKDNALLEIMKGLKAGQEVTFEYELGKDSKGRMGNIVSKIEAGILSENFQSPSENRGMQMGNCVHGMSRVFAGTKISGKDFGKQVKELYEELYHEPNH